MKTEITKTPEFISLEKQVEEVGEKRDYAYEEFYRKAHTRIHDFLESLGVGMTEVRMDSEYIKIRLPKGGDVDLRYSRRYFYDKETKKGGSKWEVRLTVYGSSSFDVRDEKYIEYYSVIGKIAEGMPSLQSSLDGISKDGIEAADDEMYKVNCKYENEKARLMNEMMDENKQEIIRTLAVGLKVRMDGEKDIRSITRLTPKRVYVCRSNSWNDRIVPREEFITELARGNWKIVAEETKAA